MRIGVIGGGAWGTALAQVAAANGEPVVLWAREHAVVTAINLAHENIVFLPGVALSPSVRATGEPKPSVRERAFSDSAPKVVCQCSEMSNTP